MNYTKQVREYCGKHSKGLIDISVVRNTVFADIPYKTLLKIFNRLEEEGIVKTVSKGVYSIGKKKIDERKILSDYTSNGKGMVVGYSLFNKIGLTLYQDERIVIYTNVIMTKQKSIGNLLLKKVDLIFTDEIIDLVSLLEILDVGFGIRGEDYLTYRNVVELLAKTYTDDNFKQVIGAIRYKYSTIVKLNELLNRLKINNFCLDLYQQLLNANQRKEYTL